MKNIIFNIISCFVILGFLTLFVYVSDYSSCIKYEKPLFMLKVNNNENVINYVGLGYTREDSTSNITNLESYDYIKFGTWIDQDYLIKNDL